MQWIKNVFDLFYPHLCFGCDEALQENSDILCDSCLLQLNFVPVSKDFPSEMKRRFYGKLLVEYGVSILYFSEKGITQKLLHQLKYKNQQKIGHFLANIALQHLKNHSVFNWADVMVCIPLHPSKEKKRGYNQLDTFCTQLSSQLNIPYHKDYLIKTSKTRTQTHKNIFQRAKTSSEFIVNPAYENWEHKNILLVDDVMTTGSTLQNAGNCILKNSLNNLSVLTMAYAKKF